MKTTISHTNNHGKATFNKKLMLSKETIYELTEAQLAGVAGGATSIPAVCRCPGVAERATTSGTSLSAGGMGSTAIGDAC
jgi:hypothetical protein